MQNAPDLFNPPQADPRQGTQGGPAGRAHLEAMAHVSRCFPSTDATFASTVARCEAGLSPDARSDPAALERALRAWYPKASVRRQTDLASLTRPRVWYVYRDGRPSKGG